MYIYIYMPLQEPSKIESRDALHFCDIVTIHCNQLVVYPDQATRG